MTRASRPVQYQGGVIQEIPLRLRNIRTKDYISVKNGNLQIIKQSVEPNSLWLFKEIDGYYHIQNNKNKKYLVVNSAGKNISLEKMGDGEDPKRKRWVLSRQNGLKFQNVQSDEYLAVENGKLGLNKLGDSWRIQNKKAPQTTNNEDSEVSVKATVAFKNCDPGAYEIFIMEEGDKRVASIRFGEVKEVALEIGSYVYFKRKPSPDGSLEPVNYYGPALLIHADQLPFVLTGPQENIKKHPAIYDNLYGYDVREMHPVNLTRAKRANPIFNDKLSTSNTIQVGEYRVHRQFRFNQAEFNGSIEHTSNTYASSDDLVKGFSIGANVGIEDPVSGAAVDASGVFSRTDSYSNNSNSVIATFEKKQSLFSVEINDGIVSAEEAPDLSIGFIVAVRDLPAISGNIKNVAAAKNHPSYNAYKKFVDDWGSHYPYRIVYGGRYKSLYIADYQRAAESHERNFGASVSGSVPVPTTPPVNINAGIDFGMTSKVANSIASSFQEDKHYWVGGISNSSQSWNVTEASAEPVQINFRAISELLNPNYIKIADLSETELTNKKNMLKQVIKSIIPNPNAWQSQRFKEAYFFYVSRWQLKNNKEGGKVYGDIYVGVGNGSSQHPFHLSRDNHIRPGEGVWKRLMNPGQRMVHVFDPNNPGNKDHFYINAQFRERDDVANKDNKNNRDDKYDKTFRFYFAKAGDYTSGAEPRYVNIGPFEIEYYARRIVMEFDRLV